MHHPFGWMQVLYYLVEVDTCLAFAYVDYRTVLLLLQFVDTCACDCSIQFAMTEGGVY
jgi:hypothetical protein